MIVDIVELPRRLKQFRRKNASITSEDTLCLPMPCLNRDVGYWIPDDSQYMLIGGIHRVVTGRDTPFRYKFIEPTKYGIAEYFVMASSPIDIMFPLRSKNVNLICPWITLVNTKTLKTRKFILWNGIAELIRHETEEVNDVPVEAVLINEARNTARIHDRADLLESLKEYPDLSEFLISEETPGKDDDLDSLATLGANIVAYNNMVVNDQPYYWCDIGDIFRGVTFPTKWTDINVVKGCTLLNHFLYGRSSINDIRHMFGMTYDMHAFQRLFRDNVLDPFTELSIDSNEDVDLFGILKYIERLPYSEFRITVDNNGKANLSLFNPYDSIVRVPKDNIGDINEIVGHIGKELQCGYPSLVSADIVRSWGEEVYITIKNSSGKTHRFYFDLVSASIGSRALVRDYEGNWFN